MAQIVWAKEGRKVKEKLELCSHLLLFLHVIAKVWAVQIMSVCHSTADPRQHVMTASLFPYLFIYFFSFNLH